MSKLGMCGTSTLFVLLALGTMGTYQAHASDGAVIEVRGEPKSEVMWFRPGATLFTDRDYRLAECPAKLAGEKFLRDSIEATHFDVVQDGHLIMLTPQAVPRAASQIEALTAQGFTRMEGDPFQLLGKDERDQMLAYEKQVASGESYQFGKYVVVLGFEDARSAINRPRAADGKGFYVYPADIPNTGVLFVDRYARGYSGHGNNSITECQNGDIIAFYSLTGTGPEH